MIIKKVMKWGGKRNRGGKIYIPERYVGRLAYVGFMDKKEEKEYYKSLDKEKRDKELREKKLKDHLKKLKRLRNENEEAKE